MRAEPAIGDERAALMHKLVHLLWTAAIEDEEARGYAGEARKLRAHMQNKMPSIDEMNARRRVEAQIAMIKARGGQPWTTNVLP